MARSGSLAVLVLATALLAATGIANAAQTQGERVSLAPFTVLRIDGPAEVILSQGRGASMVIDGRHGHKPAVRIEEEGGELSIRTLHAGSWWDRLFGRTASTPRLTITFEDLHSIALTGAVTLRAESLHTSTLSLHVSGHAKLALSGVEADVLDLDGSGAVRADVSGHVRRQSIALSGAGLYRAADLVSDDASVDVSGAGRVTVHARDNLVVNVSGAGQIDYLGDPKVTKHVSGAARIERRGTDPHSRRT